MKLCPYWSVGFLLLLLAAPVSAQTRDITVDGMRSEKRTALVIGNANYPIGRLNNPVLDARAMAKTLRDLGFDVVTYENLNYQGMRRAVADFGERIANGGVGLFYYSGHGLQVNGKNHLVPVDADLKSERYVTAETVDLDSVLAQMHEAKTRVNIVILDACRNNPFGQRFRSVARGLAFMDAPAGTYVAYATAPGSVAEDGEPGKNSVYTDELLKALRHPELRIEDVFKRVRVGVQTRTSLRQNPWDASSLTGDFVFRLPSGVREDVGGSKAFDGLWDVAGIGHEFCTLKSWKAQLVIQDGAIVTSYPQPGHVSASGDFRYALPSATQPSDMIVHYSGKLSGDFGQGTYAGGSCVGTITLKESRRRWRVEVRLENRAR